MDTSLLMRDWSTLISDMPNPKSPYCNSKTEIPKLATLMIGVSDQRSLTVYSKSRGLATTFAYKGLFTPHKINA